MNNEMPTMIEQMEAFKAWREGSKDVQYHSAIEGWLPIGTMHAIGSSTILRLKPAARLRAWKADEVPVGALIKFDVWTCPAIIVSATTDALYHTGTTSMTVRRSLSGVCKKGWKYTTDLFLPADKKTWLPCGVEETQ